MNVFESEAIAKDREDSFKPLTDLFDMPENAEQEKLVYLNGNSLGPKLKRVNDALLKQCETWGKLGVRGHFDGTAPWMTYHHRVLPQLARIVGAKTDEVIAMGTLTGNLHLALMSFYQPTPARYKIIRFAGFPSDTYAIDAQVQQRLQTIRAFTNQPFTAEDAVIEIRPDATGYIAWDRIEDVIATHGDETALVWFEAVHYLTGQRFDMARITELAHRFGAFVGFDLAHAIGNIPLNLHEWGVDFAVWCSYKYLSAGPGAIAGMYIHEQYAKDPHRFRLAGWWGNRADSRFEMLTQFDPTLTAEGFQLSNAEMFSLASLHETLCLFDTVDLDAMYAKNQRLVAYLEYLLQKELNDVVQIITPCIQDERGCQLSLRLLQSDVVDDLEQVFLSHKVVCDVRPGVIRVAPMGLYNTYQDVFYFVHVLKKLLSL